MPRLERWDWGPIPDSRRSLAVPITPAHTTTCHPKMYTFCQFEIREACYLKNISNICIQFYTVI